VLSPRAYNQKVGLAILCLITNRAKGYPFEIQIPDGLEVTGVILSDQVKNLDWRVRKATFLCSVPAHTLREVVGKLKTLIGL
jgi:mRNA interferase MazF